MPAAISHALPRPAAQNPSRAPDTKATTPSAAGWETHLRRVQTPAWLVSVVLHLAALVVMGLMADPAPRGARGVNDGRLFEIRATLSTQAPDYYDEATTTVSTAADATETNPANTAATRPGDNAFAIDAPAAPSAGLLPEVGPEPGAANPGAGTPVGAAALTKGVGPATVRLPSGKTRTSLFGVAGEGNSFVYVFDRSESMEGDGSPGATPLTRAKNELLASLVGLDDTNQFQIIFYNQEPRPCNLTGRGQTLFWGTRENKRLAEDFVASIRGVGGTEHEAALLAALKLRPDVIFFLTDGDQPSLSASQLEALARRNGGRTAIHTIQFGAGSDTPRENFLTRLARQNGGQYGYVDISAPPAREAP